MASPNTKVFTKRLSQTDAKKRLAVPTGSMGSLPSFNGSHAIRVGLVYGTKIWPIHYTIRKNGSNKRPSFTSGWSKFVAGNKLKLGDEISLYKVGSSLYRVEIDTPVDGSPRNQHGTLPSPVFSLNHGVGETDSGKGLPQFPGATDASPTMGLLTPSKMIEEKCAGNLSSDQSSKAYQVLRPNLKDITTVKSLKIFGTETSEQLGDKGKQPCMAGLAAEGVEMVIHDSSSQLDAVGEAYGEKSIRIFGAEISEKVGDKGKQPYMAGLAAEGVAMSAHGGTSQLDAAGETCDKVTEVMTTQGLA